MKVELHLYATLRKFYPPQGGPLSMDLKDGSRVSYLLEHLGIPSDTPRVVLVNGRPAETDAVLQEGDRVVLFPPVAGG